MKKLNSYNLLIVISSFVILILAASTSFFAYNQRYSALMSEADIVNSEISTKYENILDNFFQIYMPLYQNNSDSFQTLDSYFKNASDEPLSALERYNLISALSEMILRDNDVQWLAVYSPNRDINYIYSLEGNTLTAYSQDFPYLDEIHNRTRTMEIFGRKKIISSNDTFAICGGIPSTMGEGCIIAGYSLSKFELLCQNSNTSLDGISFLLKYDNYVIFDSDGNYDESLSDYPSQAMTGQISISGKNYYIKSSIIGNKYTNLYLTIPMFDIFIYCHRYTPFILAFLFLFFIFLSFLYFVMAKKLSKDVSTIRVGLATISKNNLDFRISESYSQEDLIQIAKSINEMTGELSDNIKKAHEYELKQKESELATLQSRFNPHFLYNSLEMLRNRCVNNGDNETAELIVSLSSIFRGFIGSKTYITLQEELAFSQNYLALFGARYQDMVSIRYDIDTDLLSTYVIRNILEPLIENYFSHGYDTSLKDNNYLCFCAKSIDDTYMCLSVSDNGVGISSEELASIKASLDEGNVEDHSSYGLKNIHQRLRLFYDDKKCGLDITQNPEGKGVVINMVLKK